MPVSIGVLREAAEDETRVALTPPVIATLVRDGHTVTVENGAGDRAGFLDVDYAAAGATLAAREATLGAQVVVGVGRPDAVATTALKPGQVLLGLLDAWRDADELTALADAGVLVLSLDRLPRQVSRAQTMDALSSQASIAGYRAAIVAAEAYGRYFPMMVTAAGTAKPATVLVLGAGVAGLQAIATARRLGARVTGYDVRPAAREEVTSLGAAFLATSVDAVGEGGYARELTAEESAAQRAELAAAIANFDIVITTAKVPGRRPPELVDAETVTAMRRGSVVVDLAAGPLGGNVAGVRQDASFVTDGGVLLIGAGEIARDMAPAASDAYARNIAAVIAAITGVDGGLTVDPADEVIGALLGAPTSAEVPA
jgi:NAD(P) transhydrogenase subunit alpha